MITREASALDTQVGGDHYKKYKIQPAEFCMANNIPWAEGECIVKLVRWRDKGGVEDLKKVRHMIDIMIESEEVNV